jgi:hypothetical protein
LVGGQHLPAFPQSLLVLGEFKKRLHSGRLGREAVDLETFRAQVQVL